MTTFEFNGYLFVREKIVCVTPRLVYDNGTRYCYKFDVYMDGNAVSVVGDKPYITEEDVSIARSEFIKMLKETDLK